MITGLPATGKSSFARRLAAHTGIPAFSKDVIKEIAFGILPADSRETSRTTGILSEEILLELADHFVQQSRPVIIESTFRPQFISRWLDRMRDSNVPLVCIMLKADRETLVKRFEERNRNAGHADAVYAAVLRSEPEIVWDAHASRYIEYDTTTISDDLLEILAGTVSAIIETYL